jgi:hypothetical protein
MVGWLVQRADSVRELEPGPLGGGAEEEAPAPVAGGEKTGGVRARGGGCGVGSLLVRCTGGGDTMLEAGPAPAPLDNLMGALDQ